MHHILIVEDDQYLNKTLTTFLSAKGYRCTTAMSSKRALEILGKEKIDLLLADYRLPDEDGLALLKKAKLRQPDITMVMMTNYSDVQLAVESIKSGAKEFISKPILPDQLFSIVKEAFDQKETTSQERQEKISKVFYEGESEHSKNLIQYINLIAPTELSILLLGESGTGKEYVARLIHSKSNRKEKPFVALDCGTLNRNLSGSELFGHKKGSFTGAEKDNLGILQASRGGTLFLDEIGNLDYNVQIQLLRALEERVVRPVGSLVDVNVDFRLICATNEPLSTSQNQKKFRNDLYFRINEFSLTLPPLRERKVDIPKFIDIFSKQAQLELGKQMGDLDPEALQLLTDYNWPGNLRELKNIVRRLTILSDKKEVRKEMLPLEIANFNNMPKLANQGANPYDIKSINTLNEKQLIVKALESTNYNKTNAAKLLNIGRKTLYNKLKEYGLNF